MWRMSKSRIRRENRALKRLLGFTWEELELNSQGKLSADQKAQHYASRATFVEDAEKRSATRALRNWLLIDAIVSGLLWITGVLQSIVNLLDDLAGPVCGGAVLLLALGTWQSWRKHKQKTAWLRELGDVKTPIPPVQSMTQRISRLRRKIFLGIESEMECYIVVQGKEFRVSEDSLKLFDLERVYRLYFISYGDIHSLLSVEILESEQSTGPASPEVSHGPE
jgi:hypothetical protein